MKGVILTVISFLGGPSVLPNFNFRLSTASEQTGQMRLSGTSDKLGHFKII